MSTDHAVEQGERDGIETVVLVSGELRASFAPTAGMIGCSLEHRGEELLAQRGGLAKYAQTGSTMGIPFLYPWANRLPGFTYEVDGRRVEVDRDSPLLHLDPNGLPIHGLVGGSSRWEVARAEAEADDTAAVLEASLDFGAHPDLLAAFPSPHRVGLTCSVRENELEVTTSVEATGDARVPISFGFHPYLHLPGVPRADWRVELPVRRRMLLDDRMIPTGETESVHYPVDALGERDWDDGFDELEDPPRFALSGGGREIAVMFGEGFPVAQVYGPADQDLICFEPMTAPTGALASGAGLAFVEAGARFEASWTLTVFAD